MRSWRRPCELCAQLRRELAFSRATPRLLAPWRPRGRRAPRAHGAGSGAARCRTRGAPLLCCRASAAADTALLRSCARLRLGLRSRAWQPWSARLSPSPSVRRRARSHMPCFALGTPSCLALRAWRCAPAADVARRADMTKTRMQLAVRWLCAAGARLAHNVRPDRAQRVPHALQTQGEGGAGAARRGALATFTALVRAEGVRGLYSGPLVF